MTPCKHILAAAALALAGQVRAQHPVTPHGIVIEAPAFAPYVGTTIQLKAHPVSAQITRDSLSRNVTWETSDPTTAWVTKDGALVLLKPGKVTVAARLGLLSGTRTIDVRSSGAHSIALAPDHVVLHEGESVHVSISARDARGNSISDARPNVGIVGDDATMDEQGGFSAQRAGSYLVVVELGGVSATRVIDVVPSGIAQEGRPTTATFADAERESIARNGIVRDISLRVDDDIRLGHPVRVTVDAWALGGNRVTNAPVAYAIAATPGASSGASISRDGVFVARQPGVYTIIAAVEGKGDSHTVLVRDGR